MEKIRTYDMADVTRAARLLYTPESKAWGRMVSGRMAHDRGRWQEAQIQERLERQAPVVELAERMYEAHGEWVGKKIKPLFPYLQRGIKSDNPKDAQKQVTKHYKDGLAEAAIVLSRAYDMVDSQDAVVSYTVAFVNTLKSCQRADIPPDSALKLARQSYDPERRGFVQMLQNFPDVPSVAIDRAVDFERPERLIKKYASVAEDFAQLLVDERLQDFPKRALIQEALIHRGEGAGKARRIEECLKRHSQSDSEGVGRYVVEEGKGSKIEGVPLLKQPYFNWCGYTSLSMVLQYWGYSDLTPERIYEYINGAGSYDPILEAIDPSRGPSIDTLALAAKELTSLKVDLITERQHKILRERGLEPEDVLNAYVTKRKVPTIVRKPGHFMVAIGVDNAEENYIFNDPLVSYKEWVMPRDAFDYVWAQKDYKYANIRDSSHLLLAIYPQKKKE